MPATEPRFPLRDRFWAAMQVFAARTPTQRAAAVSRFPFSAWGGSAGSSYNQRGGWGYGYRLPGSNVDYQKEVGPPWLNGPVALCLNWISRNLPEPEFQVYTTQQTSSGPLDKPNPNHPLVSLLRDPNPDYGGDALLAATAADWFMTGNAYWVKARNGLGQLQLYWVPSWQLFPRWAADGSNFIGDYLYRMGGGNAELAIPQEAVVHFRFGLDFANYRFGVGAVRPILREIYSDNEASTFTAAILHNYGMPGVMISPLDDGATIGDEGAEALHSLWETNYTGDGRGKPFVASGRIAVTPLGFSPEQLALKDLPNRAEDRICAAFGLSAMLIGLTSGAAHKTYANYGEARKAGYHECLIPVTKFLGRTLDHQLLPDLGDSARERCRWDFSAVPALAEDENEKAKRTCLYFTSGVWKRSEAREASGKASQPEDDIYVQDIQVQQAADTQKALGSGDDDAGDNGKNGAGSNGKKAKSGAGA